MTKICVIGLPRTATTSVCVALLELDFKTAHTVYWQDALQQATAMADTPIFCDYPQIDAAYPGSKFIYLQREAQSWLPSIKQLLNRMYTNLQRDDGGFNPILKRCYNEIFSPLTLENINNNDFLLSCYDKHQRNVFEHFADRSDDLLTIDVSKSGSYEKMAAFLNKQPLKDGGFKVINMAGKVTAWKQIKHPLKIESTNKGKVSALDYGTSKE